MRKIALFLSGMCAISSSHAYPPETLDKDLALRIIDGTASLPDDQDLKWEYVRDITVWDFAKPGFVKDMIESTENISTERNPPIYGTFKEEMDQRRNELKNLRDKEEAAGTILNENHYFDVSYRIDDIDGLSGNALMVFRALLPEKILTKSANKTWTQEEETNENEE